MKRMLPKHYRYTEPWWKNVNIQEDCAKYWTLHWQWMCTWFYSRCYKPSAMLCPYKNAVPGWGLIRMSRLCNANNALALAQFVSITWTHLQLSCIILHHSVLYVVWDFSFLSSSTFGDMKWLFDLHVAVTFCPFVFIDNVTCLQNLPCVQII